MDLLKMIQSLQDFIFEVVVWVLLLPKTIFQATFRPAWMVKYVNAEVEKAPEDQFDEYLAPAIFLVAVAVVPNAMFNWMGRIVIPSDLTAQLTQNNLISSTLVILTCLLFYLIWLKILSRHPVKRSGLKRLLFIQCYLVTPAQLIYIILAVLGLNAIGSGTVWLLNIFITTIYESFAFSDELKVGWLKGWWYALVPYIVLYGIWLGISFLLRLFYS